MNDLPRLVRLYGDFVFNQSPNDVVSVPPPTAHGAIKVMCLMRWDDLKYSFFLLTSFLNHILQMDLLGIFETHLSAFHRIP
jgi:hypothetical protein